MASAPSASDRSSTDSTTATRLITRNIELSREEKAEARKIAQEKRAGALEAAKEAKEQAAEAERRRKAEFDAVWDEDEDG